MGAGVHNPPPPKHCFRQSNPPHVNCSPWVIIFQAPPWGILGPGDVLCSLSGSSGCVRAVFLWCGSPRYPAGGQMSSGSAGAMGGVL